MKLIIKYDIFFIHKYITFFNLKKSEDEYVMVLIIIMNYINLFNEYI